MPPSIQFRGGNFFALVAALARALHAYPYFVVLRGLPAGSDDRPVEALIRGIARLPPDGDMTITKVEIDPEAASQAGSGTRHSRSHLALAPHTDSSFMDRPHDYVAFQIVRRDPAGGGRSMMVPIDDVVEALDDASVAALREPQFVFGGDALMPILWPDQESLAIRYYREQVQKADAARVARQAPLLDTLDLLLARLAAGREFALDDGDVLLFNNLKALHARTAMPADSHRLLYRFRAHAAHERRGAPAPRHDPRPAAAPGLGGGGEAG